MDRYDSRALEIAISPRPLMSGFMTYALQVSAARVPLTVDSFWPAGYGKGMSDSIRPFKELLFPDSQERIHSWSHLPFGRMVRLYFKPLEPSGYGFYFYAADFVESSGTLEDDWEDPEFKAKCLFYGIAYFDGIRHFYAGDEQTDNYGYLNYPNPWVLREIISALCELEQRLCHSPNKPNA